MHLPLLLRFLILLFAGWLGRHQQAAVDYLKAENAVLLELLGGRAPRLTDAQRRRLALAGHALGRRWLSELAGVVTPETILRWYGTLVARKYDGSSDRRPGRPRVPGTIQDIVVRMASENPTWGYTRVRDALSNLGHEIARTTVARILAERGLEPAPERRRRTSWREFLEVHWGALVAADFFTVEVVTWLGLVRYHVLFLLELGTRKVHLGGIARDPGEAWVLQAFRNLADGFEGVLQPGRFLILDRDPVFSAAVRAALERAGVSVVRLPPRSPNLNAFAERWVRSVRSECLGRLIPLGERHLRRAVVEYVEHYNSERNHQGLGGALIESEAGVGSSEGRVVRRKRLGGVLNYYYREAG